MNYGSLNRSLVYVFTGSLVLTAAAVSGCFATSDAMALEFSKFPTVKVPKLSGNIKLDGKLDEAAWQDAAHCSKFVLLFDTEIPPTYLTEVRVLYDADGLWFGFQCHQPNDPVATVTQRDGDMWKGGLGGGDDSIQIFVDVGCTGVGYYHFIINATNVAYDGMGLNRGWNGEWKSATARTEYGWGCEVFIPFRTFEADPSDHPLFGLNFGRTTTAYGPRRHRKRRCSWPGMKNSFHQPQLFAVGFLETQPWNLRVDITKAQLTGGDMESKVVVRVENREKEPLSCALKLMPKLVGPENQAVAHPLPLSPGESREVTQTVTFERTQPQGLLVWVEKGPAVLAAFRAKITSSPMILQSFGYPIKAGDLVDLWWCEGTYKVGRNRSTPSGKPQPVRIDVARNEYEPVQVVLNAHRPLKSVTATVEGLPAGVTAEIRKPHYVKVTDPTDIYGAKDWYPDALPPINGPVDMEANRNHPLWITFYVSDQARAGKQQCKLRLAIDGEELAEIPIDLHVFNFTLPAETHTETCYGMGVHGRWHGPLSKEQYKQVWREYLKVAASHRVAIVHRAGPPPAEIKLKSYDLKTGKVELDLLASDLKAGKVELDFTEFDEWMSYYLDELKLNAFIFPYMALPEEFTEYTLGCWFRRINIFEFPTQVLPKAGPNRRQLRAFHFEVQRSVARHLAEKGWLDKCYSYWVDEPLKSPSTYKHIKKAMTFLKREVPGVRRLLTAAPHPDLYDSVDIWVPLTGDYAHEQARQRQQLGDSVWWYVCSSPRYPWPNNFIDHPGINHRIRFWMMEKYNIEGSLYWSMTYWKHKNPWEDPRSYKDVGNPGWGNGDGFLLYPPAREPNSKTPIMDGPITTIRLAMIREGLEDREYFWLLKQRLGGRVHPALHLADKLVKSTEYFEKDPRKLYEVRRQLAKAIEEMPAGD